MKNKIKKLFNIIFFLRNIKITFSQEGEDLIIRNVFKNKKNGFFIDVGAHHPYKLSNTAYMSFFMDWKGINIDPKPGSMKIFNLLRERDISIEKAVSDKKEKMFYYIFNKPAHNTLSKEIIKRNNLKNLKLINKIEIETETINNIFKKYLPKNMEIDLMNIDVEGFDYKVINQIDFKKYKPKLILIEEEKFSFHEAKKSKIYKKLIKNDYILYAKTINTLYFLDRNFKKN